CTTGLSVRHTGERFQRANETIARYFRRMCVAFSSQEFYTKYIKLPSTLDPPPRYLQRSQKLWPFFEKCLGAIDGSHIAASPSTKDRANARDRK
ncbi:hypothetical protein EDB83DRAFT_2181734, partial [Lactarius deliciosus]